MKKAAQEYVKNKMIAGFQLDLKSFTEGANWRVNNFYHSNDEYPTFNDQYYLVLNKNNKLYFSKVYDDDENCFVIADEFGDIPMSDVKKWAYVRDFLPTNISERNESLRAAIKSVRENIKEYKESLEILSNNIRYVRFKDDDMPKIQKTKDDVIVLTYNNKTMSLGRLLSLMENEGYIAPEDF